MLKKSAFTLLELMVSVVIFSFILAVCYSLLVTSSEIYETNSQLLVFEYRISRVMNIMTQTLRESWIRNKKPIPPAPPPPVPLTFTSQITMVNDGAIGDPLLPANNDLLVFSTPNPADPFDGDASLVNWAGVQFFRMAAVDQDGTPGIDTVSEAVLGRDLNLNGNLTDIFELRELVRVGGPALFPVANRIFVLRETAAPPFPCVMTRDGIKTGGPTISMTLSFLFYDRFINQAIRANATVVFMNQQPD